MSHEHERVTLTIERKVLANAKKQAGLVPFSRYVEELLRETTKELTPDQG
jgi:hypothetical protein